MVEVVITTGGSTQQAFYTIETAGGRIASILGLVDRQEGGRAGSDDADASMRLHALFEACLSLMAEENREMQPELERAHTRLLFFGL